MTRFETAQRADLPALTALWQTCFGDSAADIRSFWVALFDKIHVWIAREEAIPAAMLCALPVTLIDDAGDAHDAAYFYAVCTAPELRSRGLCTGLMRHAEAALRQMGTEVFVLVPSNEGLFDFYRKSGYQAALYHKEYSVSAERGTAKIQRINAGAYQNLRQMQLYGSFVSYSAPLLLLQQAASETSGAGLYRIETEAEICCAAAEKQNGQLIIKELLPDSPVAAAALAAFLHCKHARVRSVGDDTLFGMVKASDGRPVPRHIYLGLAFD